KLSFQPPLEYRKDYNFWRPETINAVSDRVGGYGTRRDSAGNAWMTDHILTGKKQIGVHDIYVTLLYNAESTKLYSTGADNENFRPNEALIYHGLQFGSKPATPINDQQAGGNAIMARVNYSLLGRYLFTASIRRDGYSAFGVDNNKASFPAAAFAWVMSNEDFFQDRKSTRLNSSHVKISYAVFCLKKKKKNTKLQS